MEGYQGSGHQPTGVIKAGTFYQWRERALWDVRDSDKTVVIQLKNEHYPRLAIEVEDPPAMVASIKQPLGTLRE